MADVGIDEGEAAGEERDTRVLRKDGDAIPGAVLNEDGTVTLTLEHEVTVIAHKVAALTFKKKGVAAYLKLDQVKGKGAAVVKLLSQSADVPENTILALDEADFVAAGQILDFFTTKRRTGASS